ncbi:MULTISPECIES: hypothetical protein [unclassified Corynebacterium]|uniref:hypothetical protein n=1 Tax=unclassified Corynebacterium TaxID=2624378 RepID=UPI0035233461
MNIRINDASPQEYFGEIKKQIREGKPIHGAIIDHNKIIENLCQNYIPKSVLDMDANSYAKFLIFRHTLIAQKLRTYYEALYLAPGPTTINQ